MVASLESEEGEALTEGSVVEMDGENGEKHLHHRIQRCEVQKFDEEQRGPPWD